MKRLRTSDDWEETSGIMRMNSPLYSPEGRNCIAEDTQRCEIRDIVPQQPNRIHPSNSAQDSCRSTNLQHLIHQ